MGLKDCLKCSKQHFDEKNCHGEIKKTLVTCNCLDCPERSGGKCNIVERMEHPERFGVTPGASYAPLEWPTRYCRRHGIAMEETDVQLYYGAKSGRTTSIVVCLRCPKKEFIFFRCLNAWVLEANEKGKIVSDYEDIEPYTLPW